MSRVRWQQSPHWRDDLGPESEGGSEVFKDKLKSDYHWDGFSSVASPAAKLDDEGNIQEWQLHLFGKIKGCKFDASTFFLEQDEGNHVRIQEINLEKFLFKACTVSEWLPPTKYTWEYRTPHESDPKRYYRVKEKRRRSFHPKFLTQ